MVTFKHFEQATVQWLAQSYRWHRVRQAYLKPIVSLSTIILKR
jgi:hypothetical protein